MPDGGSGTPDSPKAAEPAQVVRLERRRPTNEELVDGLRSGETWAAGALYDAFGGLVDRFVWRTMGIDPEHDDLVQLVFINILSSVGSVKEPSRLEQWITRVTVNTVRKELRRRRFRRWFVGWDETAHADSASGPEQMLIVDRFYRVLDTLRPSDRIIFVQRFVEGHTLQEVAENSGCSLATAKRRLARAKKRFRARATRDFVLAAAIGKGGPDL